MVAAYSRGLFRIIVPMLAALGLVIVSSSAQAACYSNGRLLSAQQIGAFMANPKQSLEQNPNGGGQFIAQIRDLAASDPTTLDAIIKLLPDANQAQKSGIGSGLAQAARICVRVDQAYAARIQQAVTESKDQDLILAYASVAGDQPIGAGPGAGAAGSPGAGGGPVGTGGSPFGGLGGTVEGIGGNGVATGQFSYTSSVSGASGVTTTVSP